MTTRIPRLWQPGNPQTRVFLPDFWLKVVETPKVGQHRLPPNAAQFQVDLRMSRYDVREYLSKIYKLPVREVRTYVKMGDIQWDNPKDLRNRRALWKDEDKKFAVVFFKKDFKAEVPDIFSGPDTAMEDFERARKFQEADVNRHNERYINRGRYTLGRFFGV